MLGLSALLVLVALFDEPLPANGWWLVIGITWLLGAMFYVAGDRLTDFPLFPWLAVAAALPVPLLWLQLGSPATATLALATCGWGVLTALLGEALARLSHQRLQAYALPLSLGGLALLALAPLLGLFDRVAISLTCLLVATVLYVLLTLYRPRWWSWSSALLAGTMAYFAVFFLPAVQPYEFYPGFVLLWPALILTAVHLAARRGLQAGTMWHLPPLLLGGGVAVLAGLALLATGLLEEPGRATIAFIIVAGYAALFAVVDRRSLLGYVATSSLAVAVVFGLLYSEQDTWITPLMLLAVLYIAAGFGLARLRRFDDWATMLRWSGLILGALVSLTAPLQGGAAAVLGTAIAATFFAVEAYYRRNIWLGFPAALLYLGAYFILLIELEVTEPQVYSIGAALLGFIMHYLLVRTNTTVARVFHRAGFSTDSAKYHLYSDGVHRPLSLFPGAVCAGAGGANLRTGGALAQFGGRTAAVCGAGGDYGGTQRPVRHPGAAVGRLHRLSVTAAGDCGLATTGAATVGI